MSVIVSNETVGMILERLELGQQLALVGITRQDARQAQLDIALSLDDEQLDQASIRQTAGREEIRLGAGRITFHPARTAVQRLRGYSLDAIYLPEGQRLPPDLSPVLAVKAGICLGYSA